MRLALTVRQDVELREWFLATPNDRLHEALATHPGKSRQALFQAVENYLDRYGYRCMEELKLESLSLHDDPGALYALIRNYVGMEQLNLPAMEAREQGVRREAEARAKKGLGWRTTLLIVPRRLVFGWVLNRARFFVKNRENLRFLRTRIFGLVRDLMNALGRKLQQMDALEEARDIYYLEVDEIIGYIQGTTTTPDLKALTALRKASFAAYHHEEPDEHFETYGPTWAGNTFRNPAAAALPSADGDTLSGIGCCPGQVRAPVQVVRTSRDDVNLRGKILVAQRTDPGWVPLFPAAQGLLIERGSILSHSAIVAREMGIPTIVGLPDLLSRVESGDVVEMDGTTGVVRLHVGEAAADPASRDESGGTDG